MFSDPNVMLPPGGVKTEAWKVSMAVAFLYRLRLHSLNLSESLMCTPELNKQGFLLLTYQVIWR